MRKRLTALAGILIASISLLAVASVRPATSTLHCGTYLGKGNHVLVILRVLTGKRKAILGAIDNSWQKMVTIGAITSSDYIAMIHQAVSLRYGLPSILQKRAHGVWWLTTPVKNVPGQQCTHILRVTDDQIQLIGNRPAGACAQLHNANWNFATGSGYVLRLQSEHKSHA